MQSLIALDEAAFNALDWAEYDAVVGKATCDERKESAGDIIVDLEKRTVSVPKIRTGLVSSSRPHSRSYITFHTHPSARNKGNYFEPPSGADLSVSLQTTTRKSTVWDFVSAPEGTYITRPSQLLSEYYKRNPVDAEKDFLTIYEKGIQWCSGSVMACVQKTMEALRNSGFVAHFRAAPCIPLLTRPDLNPIENMTSREETRASLNILKKLSGPELIAADWSQVIEENQSPTAQGSSWTPAVYENGVILPKLIGHKFVDPSDIKSYPESPGPLMIFFMSENSFPSRIPPAAIEVAKHNSEVWPWLAFLSTERVQVFRADNSGLEVHGPRWFKKKPEGG
jgi:hypothetical protein